MYAKIGIVALTVTLISTSGLRAQTGVRPHTGKPVPVTADNFIRPQTDQTFAGIVQQGGFGKFHHYRELSSIDDHIVQRANRDTLYSVECWIWMPDR